MFRQGRYFKGKWLFVMFVLCLLTACSSQGDGKTENLALIKRTNPEPMDIINGMDEKDEKGLISKVKETVANEDAIYDVIVVKNGKKIIVAYKVKHLKRFHMKKIEKTVTRNLEKQFPKYNFIVSSDYKIFLESVRLNELLKEKDVPEKKAKRKFKEIEGLQKELI
ncbi:YhcN/YlaJ family sporulation lipoprotein [Peribacillus sp. CSMR9]|uniref:YhcN/YlaJ family sporulation lipoprotein n=1 Tax=Peribacillus sp. CSMR9 TaxID=2981350 RepID=UPI0029553002|nr:YhcN/YlaJ family sporulation lipoprotein [Peribacillus sp. CSMR9]MDV7766458.1 YhcN/YlaJ family sporulation lipoprotein [Peribacillus sp. CSMR9]